ncbi:hypothetical protein M0811_03427 [Anaeramoeba ignava]|uniref:PSI domain-containing protein n=1 Tax=Anaeramoeba ignava TaxID=1746090 RepID=A0A9Q0L5K3_ANAIG|nr:hypothetical protein M0811_03427 [Anaeramoeba ignava]
MFYQFLSKILLLIFLIKIINTGNASVSVCGFLFSNDCFLCNYELNCGLFCSGATPYCTSDTECLLDYSPVSLESCTAWNNLTEFDGNASCKACILHNGTFNSSAEKCIETGGDITNYTNCPTLSPAECEMWHTLIECPTDSGCFWNWTTGTSYPRCTTAGVAILNPNSPPCIMEATCEECVGNGCMWCGKDDQDYGFCSYNDSGCQLSGFVDKTCNPQTDTSDCLSRTTCLECLSDGLGCKWCDFDYEGISGSCIPPLQNCSNEDETMIFNTSCKAYLNTDCMDKDCESCFNNATCNWCITNQTTLEGICLYYNATQAFNSCQVEYLGEWGINNSYCASSNLTNCLSQTSCTPCQENECAWCLLPNSDPLCLTNSSCDSNQGIQISNCNHSNLDTYNCENLSNCSDCFDQAPFCKFIYSGENFTQTNCSLWSIPFDSQEDYFEATTCDPFVLCQERANCSDCISLSADFTCLWCISDLDPSNTSCILSTHNINNFTCNPTCPSNPEPTPSIASIHILSFFSFFFLFFFLLF